MHVKITLSDKRIDIAKSVAQWAIFILFVVIIFWINSTKIYQGDSRIYAFFGIIPVIISLFNAWVLLAMRKSARGWFVVPVLFSFILAICDLLSISSAYSLRFIFYNLFSGIYENYQLEHQIIGDAAQFLLIKLAVCLAASTAVSFLLSVVMKRKKTRSFKRVEGVEGSV